MIPSFRRAATALVVALAVAAPARSSADSAPSPTDTALWDTLWSRLRALPADRRPRVGLVLSGGGARGLAHIGVLKVLEREKVPVDLIVGTSVGALVGALYASGIPAGQIENLSVESGWSQLTDLSAARVVRLLVTERLLSTQKMEAYLTAHIGDKKFADLKTDFACVAADLRTGEQIVLREGSVALAARASATMPGIFEPVPFRHRLLVDGGIVDNVPTDVAKRLGVDLLICVYTPADFSRHTVTNVLGTLTQALYIQGQVISEERLGLADFVVRPEVSEVGAMELWRSRECVEAGQRAAESAWPELRRRLVEKFFDRWLAGPTLPGASK
ncbi:MAG TPA: patatin-like phospholipase family protein [Elusimicrobiota bacterium]|nr:patatin-like phospholipase family protein [Elusimicrobiota bacterium]HMZ25944.1 patatin-like phospholipase family protein [Elusimicrobiota bacterium]HNA60543.1 patatin-like phospholipase family protein [Elusimicrobiota bacterium]HND64273.1 patatin-like phospholipase family protein [Elusimicrobiota bacterium]HNI56386.1 patatin-like phospholipase family protein [Elusimicrobiota bacterium]